MSSCDEAVSPGRVHRHATKKYEPEGTDGVEPGDLPPFLLASEHCEGGKFYYGVRIVTGSQKDAKADFAGNEYIKLHGNKASSQVKLGTCLTTNRYHRQHFDDLVLETDQDLGDVLVVTLGNCYHGAVLVKTFWFVDFVMIYDFKGRQGEEFPFYHWIGAGDYDSCTSHTSTLKEVAGIPALQQQRKDQLHQRRGLYRWKLYPDDGFPSSIETAANHLPPDEQFERVKSVDFTKDALAAFAIPAVKLVFEKFDTLDAYEKLAEALGGAEIQVYKLSRWQTDVEFGRQMLNGVNPVVICKCTALPPNFPVTNDMVKGLLNRGHNLKEEMEAGHVYICDLTIMDGLATRVGYFNCAPMCLLYVNGSNQLVPIAIQLKKLPGEDNPIFLPTDNLVDWTLAKIYYQSAHSQFHQLSTHYISCHAAMETYGMATMRNLPDPHPIFKLLCPHFRYTMAINARARETLINHGGIIDKAFAIGGEGKSELIRRAFSAYSVQWTNIKRSVKDRGVDDPKHLPGYHYRDDGLKVWNAIECYARKVIQHFYPYNADVANDSELQAWAEDIHTTGFPAFQSAPTGHGFPKRIETIEELTEICTLLMFTGSAQHAAVNFGQYEMYGFVPNAPFGVRQPPPSTKGVADMQFLLHTLPDKETALSSAALTHSLAQYSRDERYLGNFPYGRFTEEPVRLLIKQFQEDLEAIAANIVERNKHLDVPYTYLLPERVPNSVTI